MKKTHLIILSLFLTETFVPSFIDTVTSVGFVTFQNLASVSPLAKSIVLIFSSPSKVAVKDTVAGPVTFIVPSGESEVTARLFAVGDTILMLTAPLP